MNVRVVQVYAVVFGLIGIFGLFTEGHLLGLMNVDMPMDLLRLVVTGSLVYGGFLYKQEGFASILLLIIGTTFSVIGLAGLVYSTLWNLLPTGLTGFDVVFMLITGMSAVGIGATRSEEAIERI